MIQKVNQWIMVWECMLLIFKHPNIYLATVLLKCLNPSMHLLNCWVQVPKWTEKEQEVCAEVDLPKWWRWLLLACSSSNDATTAWPPRVANSSSSEMSCTGYVSSNKDIHCHCGGARLSRDAENGEGRGMGKVGYVVWLSLKPNCKLMMWQEVDRSSQKGCSGGCLPRGKTEPSSSKHTQGSHASFLHRGEF